MGRVKPIKSMSEYERSLKMSSYGKLVEVVEAVRGDVEKAEAGNKAATSRVRKAMQEIKTIAQDIRKEMLALRDK